MFTRLQIERWAPLVIASGVGLTWYVLDCQIASSIAKEFLAALLSSASIAAGFLTTALSILLPMSAMSVGKQLKNSKYLPYLFAYLRRAIYGCLWLAAVSVLGFFSIAGGKEIPLFLTTLIVWSSVYAALALARIAEVLMNLFERTFDNPG